VRRGSPAGPRRAGREEGTRFQMLTGFNTNIRHRGVLFHVQTEDSGRAHPHVITHLYHGGTILSSEKRGYQDRLEADDLATEVRKLMEAQHKEMLKRLRRGEFDGLIEQRLGAGVFLHEHDVSAQTQPDGISPDPTGPATPPPPGAFAGSSPDAPLDELVLDYLVERSLAQSRSAR